MEEPAYQLVGHLANPSIAPVDDVYYLMNDLMGTPAPNSQATATVANWDSDWHPTLSNGFR